MRAKLNRFALAILLALAVPASAFASSYQPLAPNAPPPEAARVPIALLTDVGSGQILYASNIDRRFMPASITKVMTAYVAFELLSKGQLTPNQRFRMSDGAFAEWHRKGSTMFIQKGMDITVDELLHGITTVSANDACIVLAEGAAGSVANWVALMNAEARKLGMKDSHFGTPNGWMDGGNTYVSANDLARLATAILTRHPDMYHRYIGHPTMTWNGITQHNHDPTLGVVPGADGIKTGFTYQAGYGFLGSAERDGRRLVMVVGSSPTPQIRAQVARVLLEWGFSAWEAHPLFPAKVKVGEALVQGGDARRVSLVTPRAYYSLMPKGVTQPKVAIKIVYSGPLIAPIAKGSPVAELEVSVPGQPAHRMQLLAGEAVKKAGFFDRLLNGLAGIFG